jgi:hypothetical protein
MLATVVVASRLAGQSPDTLSKGHLLISRIIRPPYSDTVVVVLHQRGDYRIALNPGSAIVSVAPARRGAAQPFVPLVRTGDAAHPAFWELYPGSDGPHVIRVDGRAASVPVQVWLWEDSATEVAAKAKEDQRWHIGLSAGAGMVNRYSLADPTCHCAVNATIPRASRYVEFSVVVASRSRFGALFGYGHDFRSPGVPYVNWGFVEPRYRTGTTSALGQHFDVNVTVRIAQGDVIEGPLDDPAYLGAGILLNDYLNGSGRPKGLTLSGYASLGAVGDFLGPRHFLFRAGLALAGIL